MVAMDEHTRQEPTAAELEAAIKKLLAEIARQRRDGEGPAGNRQAESTNAGYPGEVKGSLKPCGGKSMRRDNSYFYDLNLRGWQG
jgi:hypothetical protein